MNRAVRMINKIKGKKTLSKHNSNSEVALESTTWKKEHDPFKTLPLLSLTHFPPKPKRPTVPDLFQFDGILLCLLRLGPCLGGELVV